MVAQTHSLNVFLSWFRSKEIEATGCNGDAAFLAVRVQQVVIEFILNHVDQIFNNGSPGSLDNDGMALPGIHHARLPSFLALVTGPQSKLGWAGF